MASKTDPFSLKKNDPFFLKNVALDLLAWKLWVETDPYIKAPGSNDQKRLYSSAENNAEIKPSSTSQPD